MIIRPRDYQIEALQQTREKYDLGYNRLLGHAATGLGKTIIALFLPEYFPELFNRGMVFIAHRREIIFQTYSKFKTKYPDKWIAIEMGDSHATGMEDIILISAQTAGREISDRISKFSHRHFGIVVTDEGHHAIEDSIHDNILTYFGVGSNDVTHYTVGGLKPLSLFLTATPNRTDGKSLSKMLDEVSFSYNTLFGIRGGWLTDIRAYQLFDRSGSTGTQDLFTSTEIDFLTKVIKENATRHKTLLFARSVEQSKILSDTLCAHRILRSAHVDATTDDEERRRIVREFREGAIDLVSNMLVFTEGTDFPAITCIIDNAPTKSTLLHLQKIGRGLRPHPKANVDLFDTAEERKEAIRRSPKESLLYISTFDPTEHKLNVVATIWEDENVAIDPEGHLIVKEVIDYIEQIEEEEPERNIREIGSLSEIKYEIKRADVWKQTIYNEDLKLITPLRWVIDNDNAYIYLTENPFTDSTRYRNADCVIGFESAGDTYKMVTYEGGWNGRYPAPNRKVVRGMAHNLQSAIRKTDIFLSERGLVHGLYRSNAGEPTAKLIKYLKNKGIKFKDNITKEAAELLKEHNKIKQKVESCD